MYNKEINKRHAYMIMAHNQLELLNILIKELDVQENDIIVHLDLKSRIKPEQIGGGIRNARVFIADRVLVTWGGYSQIAAELSLMKKAKEAGHHIYYHLLTGVDLPLKPIREINDFFDHCGQKEFLNYSHKKECLRLYELRIEYLHYFRDRCGRSKNIYTLLNKAGIILQKCLRHKSSFDPAHFYCGSAYWDITEDLLDYILSNEKQIEATYKYTSCCDEVFVHSLVWNSEFKERLYVPKLGNGYEGNMRWIDMVHGQNAGPYIIQDHDVARIAFSGMLFARKFDYEMYPDAVNSVVDILKKDD